MCVKFLYLFILEVVRVICFRMFNVVRVLMDLESQYHRKISLIVHLSIAIYLMMLLYSDSKTPPYMLMGLGVFSMLYGVILIMYGLDKLRG